MHVKKYKSKKVSSKASSKTKNKKKCSKAHIYRKGYTRKVGSKTVRIPGKCIKSTSQSGKKTTDIFKKYQKQRTRSQKMARALSKNAPKKCPKGQILREGSIRKNYKRKSYTRKDGSRVKSSKVKKSVLPPICVKDTGKPGHGKQLFSLTKDDLKPYGYKHVAKLSKSQRRKALDKAIAGGFKPLPLFRKLNALYVLNINKDKKLATIFKEDRNYVKSTKAYKRRKTKTNTKSKDLRMLKSKSSKGSKSSRKAGYKQ